MLSRTLRIAVPGARPLRVEPRLRVRLVEAVIGVLIGVGVSLAVGVGDWLPVSLGAAIGTLASQHVRALRLAALLFGSALAFFFGILGVARGGTAEILTLVSSGACVLLVLIELHQDDATATDRVVAAVAAVTAFGLLVNLLGRLG